MAERKEAGAGMRRMSEIVVVLLVSLAAGLLAALLVGIGAAALTLRGSVRVTQLTGAALGALFLAGLTAGLLCLRKMGLGYGERGGAAVRLSALRPARAHDTAQPPFCAAFGRRTGGRARRSAEIAEND